RRGIAVARAARRLHRQAHLAAGRIDLYAGAVRHRPDLEMLRKLWSRVQAFFAKLFRRVPVPGRYEADSRSALRGSLASAPWIWPSRESLVYVPRGHARWRRVPLVVMIHGCRQKAEDIAEGTRITALADELGCLVMLPRQNPRANSWGCWNWFDGATVRGWGET